jgi:uncharacterized protein (TIGR00730 family)
MNRICVYCGSSPGGDAAYREAARALGTALVGANIQLVYGGGDVGLMGEVANAVLDAGGSAVGVIPEFLVPQVSHRKLTELHVVPTMHERKQLMADLADGFIALPGGFGTLEEITEVLTWAQLGLHRKPCGLLNAAGYFDALLSFLDHAVREGFVRQAYRDMLLVSADPAHLLKRLDSYTAPTIKKWTGLERSS